MSECVSRISLFLGHFGDEDATITSCIPLATVHVKLADWTV